ELDVLLAAEADAPGAAVTGLHLDLDLVEELHGLNRALQGPAPTAPRTFERKPKRGMAPIPLCLSGAGLRVCVRRTAPPRRRCARRRGCGTPPGPRSGRRWCGPCPGPRCRPGATWCRAGAR